LSAKSAAAAAFAAQSSAKSSAAAFSILATTTTTALDYGALLAVYVRVCVLYFGGRGVCECECAALRLRSAIQRQTTVSRQANSIFLFLEKKILIHRYHFLQSWAFAFFSLFVFARFFALPVIVLFCSAFFFLPCSRAGRIPLCHI